MIERKLFRSVCHKYLIDYGFNNNRGNYILNFPELRIVISLQRSAYSDSYYINLGYFFTEAGLGKDLPKAMDGDIRTRFSVEIGGKDYDLFELESISKETLLHSLQMNIKNYVSEINNIDTIQSLLKREPILLYQTTSNAKLKLGFIM